MRNSDKENLYLAFTLMEAETFHALNLTDTKTSTEEGWLSMQRRQTNLRGHRSSLGYLSALLQSAKAEIASNGYLSERIRTKILLTFCFWDCRFALSCFGAAPPETKVNGDPPGKAEVNKASEEASDLEALIDDQLKNLCHLRGYALEHEELERDAEARSYSLPPADVADKLLRYEAHLDRQLYRAMDQLERLQRRRSGENVRSTSIWAERTRLFAKQSQQVLCFHQQFVSGDRSGLLQ